MKKGRSINPLFPSIWKLRIDNEYTRFVKKTNEQYRSPQK